MMETVVLAEPPNTVKLMLASVANSRTRPSPADGLPSRSFGLSGLRLTIAKLAAYNEVCRFGLTDRVPATWLHVQTFGLQLAVMAQSDFPFILPGLVHVRNEMRLHRPVHPRDALDVRVWADNLAPHRRGATFDLCGEISVNGEVAWTGTSTYLSRREQLPGEQPKQPRLSAPEGAPSQIWGMPADLGRRYARVAGDYNPIHLNPATSRLFGFKRPIIQGMWTHARALAAFGGTLPQTYGVKVSFLKPIMLPGKAAFRADQGNFSVGSVDSDEQYLVGELSQV